MTIRILLIVSLVTQLAWSMECCGVVVLRPDLVADQSMDCVPLGTCTTQVNCCTPAPEISSCCAETAACDSAESDAACETACGVGCDSGTPCGGTMCSPLEQKKPSPAAIVIDFEALVAHPLIPAALELFVARPQNTPATPMFFKCNHTRQAWLEVWRN